MPCYFHPDDLNTQPAASLIPTGLDIFTAIKGPCAVRFSLSVVLDGS